MFAWACTMAFAANGVPPFGNDSVPAIMQRVLYGEPDLGALTDRLRDLVTSCLAKDPAARLTATQVLQRLLGIGPDANLLAEGTSAATQSPARTPPPVPWTPPSAAPPADAGAPRAEGGMPPGAGPSFGPGPSFGGGTPPGAGVPPVADMPAGAGPPFGGGTVPGSGGAPLPPAGFPYGAGGPPAGRSGRPLLVVGAVAGVLLVVGGLGTAILLKGGGGEKARKPVAQTRAGAATCTYPPANNENVKSVGTPPTRVPAGQPTKATIKTNLGTLELTLDPAAAPCTVNSLAFLVGKGFYNGTSCHRLTTNPTLKVLQCGDPTGTGAGGPSYMFANENTSGVSYSRGTVAMANAGPNTNGSQFFILYDDAPDLQADYPVFGKVTSGMDIIDRVAEGGTKTGADDGPPKQRVTITEFSTSAA
jgi:cyclophilin family peptidyl-prolyl cis-trans isomerase